ncbi:MAG: hypothetical protein IJ437_03710 [Clostridia bacterium]|nr:hypothetical protein [Clostridia bacterium]
MEIKRSDLLKNRGHIKVSSDDVKNIKTSGFEKELNEILAELLAQKYMGGDNASTK